MITDPELAAVLLLYTVNRFLVYPNIQSNLPWKLIVYMIHLLLLRMLTCCVYSFAPCDIHTSQYLLMTFGC